MEDIFSVKMRASLKTREKSLHISGAERIVNSEQLQNCIDSMTKRALEHSKGTPNEINIKLEKLSTDEILTIPCLKTTTVEVDNKDEGLDYIRNFLKRNNVKNVEEIINLLLTTRDMSGAILLDMNTFERLEHNPLKGVRVTNMDYKNGLEMNILSDKSHYREALALASKVVYCPQIWGEICISDDPNYVTGYIATKSEGYVRITKLKELGSSQGARIFLYNGSKEEIKECIDYLTEKKVWIDEEKI